MDNDVWNIEAINFLFSLLLAVITGVIAYLWGRRRARERDLFLLWRNAFDRAAFRGQYQIHSSKEDFRTALSQTLKTIATGRIIDGHGQELGRVEGVYFGPSQIRNKKRREAILDVRNRLQEIRQRSIDDATNEELDDMRDEIIKKLNKVWEKLRIAPMLLPTEFTGKAEILILEDLKEEKNASRLALR